MYFISFFVYTAALGVYRLFQQPAVTSQNKRKSRVNNDPLPMVISLIYKTHVVKNHILNSKIITFFLTNTLKL